MSNARRTIGLLLALLLSVALTACGDDGEDLSAEDGGDAEAPETTEEAESEESEEPAEEDAEEPAEELIPVSMLDTAGTPSAFMAYGIQEGFFEEEGLDIDLEAAQGGAAAIPALTNGDVDIAGSNVVSAMIAISRGLPLVLVAAGTSTAEDPENDFGMTLVAADSDIAGPEDLGDKRVAVNTLQNINDIVLFSALDERGVDRSALELVEMPFPDMVPAVASGEVDAAMLIEPFVTIGLDEGLRSVLSQYTDMSPGLQIGTFLMTEETAAGNPDMVAAFQAGVQATADAIASDPDAFREALPDIGNFDPELAPEISLPDWQGANDLEDLEAIRDAMEEYGLLEGELELTDEIVLG